MQGCCWLQSRCILALEFCIFVCVLFTFSVSAGFFRTGFFFSTDYSYNSGLNNYLIKHSVILDVCPVFVWHVAIFIYICYRVNTDIYIFRYFVNLFFFFSTFSFKPFPSTQTRKYDEHQYDHSVYVHIYSHIYNTHIFMLMYLHIYNIFHSYLHNVTQKHHLK